jgi:hypothetical protein
MFANTKMIGEIEKSLSFSTLSTVKGCSAKKTKENERRRKFMTCMTSMSWTNPLNLF